MSSIPIIEGETSEQRRARMAQAAIGHARRKAEMRAEEAAQGRLLPSPFAVMPEMQPTPVPEMPPGYADYLQELAVMPTPVPEMPPGYADYLQELAVSPVMPEIEVRGVRPPKDTREVIAFIKPPPGVRGGDTRIFADQPTPPMSVPSASDYISNMIGNGAPPVALPGGSGYDERGNMLKKPAQPRLSDMLRGIGSMMPPMRPTSMPSTAPGLLGGIMPQMQPMMPMDRGMSPPPGFGLDDNANRPTVNREFNALRERYADQGLRAAINEYYRGGSVMRYR